MLHSTFANQTPSVRASWAPTSVPTGFTSAKGTDFTWYGWRNLVKRPQTWTSKQEPFPVAPTVLDFYPTGSPVMLCTQPVLSIQEIAVPALPGRKGLESSWIRSHLRVLNTPALHFSFAFLSHSPWRSHQFPWLKTEPLPALTPLPFLGFPYQQVLQCHCGGSGPSSWSWGAPGPLALKPGPLVLRGEEEEEEHRCPLQSM